LFGSFFTLANNTVPQYMLIGASTAGTQVISESGFDVTILTLL